MWVLIILSGYSEIFNSVFAVLELLHQSTKYNNKSRNNLRLLRINFQFFIFSLLNAFDCLKYWENYHVQKWRCWIFVKYIKTIKRNYWSLSYKNEWHLFVFTIKCNIEEWNIAFVKATHMILGNHWILHFQNNCCSNTTILHLASKTSNITIPF